MSTQAVFLPTAVQADDLLSPEAILVRDALREEGLETPMYDNGLSPQQKYDRIRALIYRLRHVRDFGAGRHGAVDHAFQHLRRHDHRLALEARLVDDLLLQRRHLGDGQFHAQIAARHHDSL